MEHISDIIRKVIRERGLEKPIERGEVLALWPKIIGEKIAEHARAVALESGILFLEVDDSAWRNELSLLSGELVKKINDYFQDERVQKIHLM